MNTLIINGNRLGHGGPLSEQIKIALQEIHHFFGDAYDARRAARENSAEWHKRTGEALAYARMTALLSMLEVVASESPDRETNRELKKQTRALIESEDL